MDCGHFDFAVIGARISSNNTMKYLEFRGGGNIIGTNNVIDTLVFTPGRIYTFANATTTTINDAWYGSGTPCNLTEIKSPTGATVNMTSGNVVFDYARINNIIAGGNTPFQALEHCIDIGGNQNWIIEPYNGTAPIVGLGPDITILTTDLPWTLTTEGFFGSPLSQYLWNDSSTEDHLVIVDSGTYSVEVSFIDGCSVSDEIKVSLEDPLPIKLLSFDATKKGQVAVLDWITASEENNKGFEVERSVDGKNWKQIGFVATQAEHGNSSATLKYQFVDEQPIKGANIYRLKQVDLDGAFEYSKVRQLVFDNLRNVVQVYPNPAQDYVILDGLSLKATILVVNAVGQEVMKQIAESNTMKLHISSLPVGMYYIHILQDGIEVQIEKVMITK